MTRPHDARSASIPPAARLERAALCLAAEGRLTVLVAMVDRWAQLGEPTTRARLLQIRGLLDLCMTDRAWTRLKALPDLSQLPELDREAMTLTARMFHDRGWPRRARKVVDEGLIRWPDDPGLMALAAAPPRPQFPSDPPSTASLDEHLAVAESWLATGAFLKARRLLENLVRVHPDASRPAELMWALRGEYDLQGTSLRRLADQYAPDAPNLPTGDDDDEPRDPTEAVPIEGPPQPVFTTYRSPLDTLPPDAPDDINEVTQATRLEDLPRMTSAGRDADEDTQVMRIVATDLSRPHDDDERDDPSTSPGIADELEGEDEAVVLLTRHAERQPPHKSSPPQAPPDLGPRKKPKRPPAPKPEAPADPAPLPWNLDAVPTWAIVALAGLLGGAGVLALLAVWYAGGLG